jgi:hypothetical protein
VRADVPDGLPADAPVGVTGAVSGRASRSGVVRRRFLSGCAAWALVTAVAACGPATNDEVAGAEPAEAAQPASSDGGGDADDPSDEGGEDKEEEAGAGSGQKDRPDVPKPDPDDYPGKDEHTAEGAEQAFRYFVAQMIWSYQTGDTEEWNSLYSDSCQSCGRDARGIDDLASDGLYWSRTPLEFIDTNSYDSKNFETEIVSIVSIGAHEEPIRGNTKTTKEPGGEYAIGGGLDWSDGRWVLGGLEIEAYGGEGDS